MKKTIYFIFFCMLFLGVHAQDKDTPPTKMDAFTSQTGVILKFVDYKLPAIKSSYGNAETNIRTILSNSQKKFFFQISYKGKYDTKKASIAYEDLLEVLKAIETLEKEVASDIALAPDYLENKFVTEDGFQVGYYINQNSATWYIVLEKYGNGNTIFLKDAQEIKQAFQTAKEKIESLQGQK